MIFEASLNQNWDIADNNGGFILIDREWGRDTMYASEMNNLIL